MGVVSMKVHHHLPRTTPTAPTTATGFFWEQQQPPPSLSLSFPAQQSSSSSSSAKRLRPLAPKLASPPPSPSASSFDLKSFIRPESGPRRASTSPSHDNNNNKHALAQHPGGTRWNPTQEQIGILEMLYRGGMRTPNAQQIEQITSQLGRYGKIEGKNVFYWFQNHKARERQKQKRTTLALSHSPPTPFAALDIRLAGAEMMATTPSPCKRKCRSWGIQRLEFDHHHHNYYQKQESSGGSSNTSSSGGGGGGEDVDEHEKVAAEGEAGGAGDRTLELFPLHPEGRRSSPSSS